MRTTADAATATAAASVGVGVGVAGHRDKFGVGRRSRGRDGGAAA